MKFRPTLYPFLAMIPTLLDFLVLRNGKASVDSLEVCVLIGWEAQSWVNAGLAAC